MAVGINYNFNNSISKPQFRGQQTNPQIDSQAKKEGLSDGAKWGVGLGLTALGAIGLYAVSRGRAGSKSVKQLAEHIEFKPAKTVEEAKKFAQETFGIKLDLGDNLFAANFVNESCVNVSNKMKGKAYFPKKIEFGTVGNSEAPGGFCKSKNLITIDCKNSFENTGGVDFYSIFNKNLNEKYLGDYSKFIEEKGGLGIIPTMRQLIFHELGHCNHASICKDYRKMGKLKELDFNYITDKSITNEFLNTKYIQETAGKVSDYAKESPLEFVAETFAGLVEGKKFSDNVMALYKKYGGPALA